MELEATIENLPISTRAKNVLKSADICSVDELKNLTKEQILTVPNAGRWTAGEILRALRLLHETSAPDVKSDETCGAEISEAFVSKHELQELIERLPLSVRATNALKRSHYLPSDLRRLNRRQLLAMKNVGRKTADEILVAFEQLPQPADAKAIESAHTPEPPPPEKQPAPAIITLLDPTPSDDLLQRTLEELGFPESKQARVPVDLPLKELVSLSLDQAEDAWHLDDLAFFDLARVLSSQGIRFIRIPEKGTSDIQVPNTLEDEFALMLEVIRSPENRPKVAMVLGWDGGTGTTLREAGDHFNTSRQRVCQLRNHLESSPILRTRPWPLVGRALAMCADSAPCSADEAELRLKKAKLVRNRISIEGILSAAALLKKPVPFEFDRTRRLLVPLGLHGIQERMRRIAQRSMGHHGAATVSQVIDEVNQLSQSTLDPDQARVMLEHLQGFSWLDSDRDWFWIRKAAGAHNRLMNQIRKVLSVVDMVRVDDLYAAVTRHYELASACPPFRIVLEFCRQWNELIVENGFVRHREKLFPYHELSKSEFTFLRVIRERGPVLPRPDVEDLMVKAGLSYPTASITIQHSVIVKRFRHNAYGLVGSEPGEAAFQRPPRRPRRRTKVEWKWIEQGRLQLAVPMSRSVLLSGVFAIPAPVRQFLTGNFTIVDEAGRPAGVLRCHDKPAAWGLRPLLQNKPNSAVINLTFDLVDKTVWATRIRWSSHVADR